MRIICVCGTGQGSSLILRMSIEEILASHGYQAEVEHTDPSCACGERCDFIVTSKEIAASVSNPHAKILTITNFINKSVLEQELAEMLAAFGS